MMELWLYHLERAPLDQVLPALLEKTRANNWRALIHSPDAKRLEWLDQWLWSYRDDSFLAHGRSMAPRADQQPILLSTEHQNENKAQIAFVLDGGDPDAFVDFERVIVMFDGADDTAVQGARDIWKRAKKKKHSLRYWKQNASGKWEDLAG